MRSGEMAEVLGRLAADMEHLVLPDLNSARTRFICSMMLKMLRVLEGQLRVSEADLLRRARDNAVRVSQVLARGETVASSRTVTTLDTGVAVEDQSSFVGVPRSLLQELDSAVGATASSRDDSTTRRMFEALIEVAETQSFSALGGGVGSSESGFSESGSGAVGGMTASAFASVPLTKERVEGYLRATQPAFKDAHVTACEQVPGGFSKDTFLISVQTEGQAPVRLALRRDQPYASVASTVTSEFGLLSWLTSKGFPAPQPIWCENDAGPLGQRTMATTVLPGAADVGAWSAEPQRARAIALHAARLLGQLHSLDPSEAPAIATEVAGWHGKSPLDQVERLYSFWREKRRDPNPLMELCFEWLHSHAPQSVQRRCIVHGDYGFHNFLISGSEITGVLDWEFSNVGDAQDDISWVRQFICKVMPWHEFLQHYREAGGIVSEPRAEKFYSVLGGVRISVACHSHLYGLFSGNRAVDTKLAYIGWSYADRFLIDAARLILQA